MAAHRVPSLVAADLSPGVPAGCRHAADVDGMRGDCRGPSQASTGQDAATSCSRTHHRRLTRPSFRAADSEGGLTLAGLYIGWLRQVVGPIAVSALKDD